MVNGNVPFILYFIAGYVPWFFFSDAVSTGMNSIVSNGYLVKRVDFKVNILPVVKIISASFLHFLFLIIMIIVFLLQGYAPSIYWLQLPFYTLMLFVFLLGINYLMSSLRVFTKDIAQVVAVILQFGFWVTPIFWSVEKIPAKYLSILELNPMYYILTGYRNSFINHVWFWETPMESIYFLSISLFTLFVGGVVFRKLRPHFGDVI
jgi:ABC-type polysaccharide/polyol phosphate export permease